MTHIPEASSTSASGGSVTSPCFPRAAILPSRMTRTPFSIVPLVTVRIRPALMTSGLWEDCAPAGIFPARRSAAVKVSRPARSAPASERLLCIVDHLSVDKDFFHTAGQGHRIPIEYDKV